MPLSCAAASPCAICTAVVDGFANRERAALQDLTQVRRRAVRRRDRARLESSELIYGEDVGMVERGCGLGLLLEASQPVGIPGNIRRQDLDRDFALQGRIAGAVDLAHSACTQQAENFIAIEFRARS